MRIAYEGVLRRLRARKDLKMGRSCRTWHSGLQKNKYDLYFVNVYR